MGGRNDRSLQGNLKISKNFALMIKTCGLENWCFFPQDLGDISVCFFVLNGPVDLSQISNFKD